MDQVVFETVYRGRQSVWHHMSYMRLAKVWLALELLRQSGMNLAEKKIFDYGFGAGTLFHYLPKTANLFGVEQDPKVCEEVAAKIKKKWGGRVDLAPIEIERWTEHRLLKQKYDLIVCSHVLEHLPEPEGLLKVLGECLSPTGRIVGLVPIHERAENPHHVQKASKGVILSWAKSSGLEVEKYLEGDPWLYWLQPIYTHDAGAWHMVSQGISLGSGFLALLLGPRMWARLGRIFGALTGSLPTQAAFILKKR